MFEKVNKSHPDKIADRIAGALVDLAYSRQSDPKVAVEVLIGHSLCHIVAESSVHFSMDDVLSIVHRIAGDHIYMDIECVPQDKHLAENQQQCVRCGDNGIFKGMPITAEQQLLADLTAELYKRFPTDGKFIIREEQQQLLFTLCQSCADSADVASALYNFVMQYKDDAVCGKLLYGNAIAHTINPLGDWTGGLDVDTGATNRKLGSDMGDAVTGGGLHGKDLSKADVSINVLCHLMAQQAGKPVTAACAIGDKEVVFHYVGDYDNKGNENTVTIPYEYVVAEAGAYIHQIGGFEKLAEYGLVRPRGI